MLQVQLLLLPSLALSLPGHSDTRSGCEVAATMTLPTLFRGTYLRVLARRKQGQHQDIYQRPSVTYHAAGFSVRQTDIDPKSLILDAFLPYHF